MKREKHEVFLIDANTEIKNANPIDANDESNSKALTEFIKDKDKDQRQRHSCSCASYDAKFQ